MTQSFNRIDVFMKKNGVDAESVFAGKSVSHEISERVAEIQDGYLCGGLKGVVVDTDGNRCAREVVFTIRSGAVFCSQDGESFERITQYDFPIPNDVEKYLARIQQG